MDSILRPSSAQVGVLPRFLDYYQIWFNSIYTLEIKPSRLGSRIRDVEEFWYKTEIKIVHPGPNFSIFKTKKNT